MSELKLQISSRHFAFWICIILLTMVFNSTFGLAQFPPYYYDEGVYISRAIAFSPQMELYESSTYIDHPPLGWIILSAFFQSIDFPKSFIAVDNPENLASKQVELLFLIPRLFTLPFLVASGVLTYKISTILYAGNRKYSIMALVAFATIPAFWPFRSVLIDPLMMFFLLLSLYVMISKAVCQNAPVESDSKRYSQVRSQKTYYKYAFIATSGSFFVIAILIKLTAIFFAPAFLIFLMLDKPKTGMPLLPSTRSFGMDKQGNKVINGGHVTDDKSKIAVRLLNLSLWLGPIVLGVLLWLLILLAFGYNPEDLVATQYWQITRQSAFPYGIAIPFLLVILPLGFVFGVVGLASQLRNRSGRKWVILTIPYFAFLLRGGAIGFSHVIPLTPFLSFFAGEPLWNMFRRMINVVRFRSNGPNAGGISKDDRAENSERLILDYLVPLLMLLSILTTIWIASFDATKPDREATMYLIKMLPVNSTLVADHQYLWILNIYRPDVKVVDYYTLNFLHPAPNDAYFAERTNVRTYDSGLQQSESMLKSSCVQIGFVNQPSTEHLHPLSLIPEDMKWWNVQIRHYSADGC